MSITTHPPLDILLGCLDVEALDADLFIGDPGPGEGRLYGGMVAAQSVMAACRTVDVERTMHSLHAYFLRPGRHDVPLRFVVDRIRDGRSFTTRRVKAHQAGEAVFSLEASFVVPEEGISHQDPIPDVPGPEGIEDYEQLRCRAMNDPKAARDGPLDVRMVDPIDLADPDLQPQSHQKSWMRFRGKLPDDPIVHMAMLTYLSDRTLMGTTSLRHGLTWRPRMGASLDHAMWIHHPVVLDDWVLYTNESPAAHAARGINFGAIYNRDGIRLATVAQEGLVRVRKR
jgi:acyl-CoA thioesterase-2